MGIMGLPRVKLLISCACCNMCPWGMSFFVVRKFLNAYLSASQAKIIASRTSSPWVRVCAWRLASKSVHSAWILGRVYHALHAHEKRCSNRVGVNLNFVTLSILPASNLEFQPSTCRFQPPNGVPLHFPGTLPMRDVHYADQSFPHI